MRSSFRFILCLISADIIIIAILLLCSIAGVFSNNQISKKDLNTSSDLLKDTTKNTDKDTLTEPDTESDTYINEPLSQDITEHFFVLNTTSKVYLRDEASTNGNILSELSANSYGEVLGMEGSWTKVLYEGNTGYVFSEYIITGDSAENMINRLGSPKIIINKSCHIRNSPDTNSPVTGTAPSGTIYNYIESLSDESWYAIIMPDGSTSYISTGYADITN